MSTSNQADLDTVSVSQQPNQTAQTMEPSCQTSFSSRVPGFYKWSITQRMQWLKEQFDLSTQQIQGLLQVVDYNSDAASNEPCHLQKLSVERADKMVENCIGLFSLPIGLGLNFTINQKDYVVPMVVEEPSVLAAVSHIARLARPSGGFSASSDPSIMIAQIQVVECLDLQHAAHKLAEAHDYLVELADQVHPNLKVRGGGVKGFKVRVLDGEHPMLILHCHVDCIDAMGANAVNSIAEGIAPEIEKITGGKVYLRILSNLADQRLARAQVKIAEDDLKLCRNGQVIMSGAEVAKGIVYAYQFADLDPYRAATHNKGIMNGIDAVVIATGNDWRGVEAGAHAYAAQSGRYRSLTKFWREEGFLCASIELPMAVATVGGSTQVHPTVKTLRQILNVNHARELAQVCAAVGLAQNIGALKALATEGIQRGHMSLHSRSVALAVGAEAHEVDALAQALVNSGQVKADVATKLLKSMRETTK